jgi:hypothetical protein
MFVRWRNGIGNLRAKDGFDINKRKINGPSDRKWLQLATEVVRLAVVGQIIGGQQFGHGRPNSENHSFLK